MDDPKRTGATEIVQFTIQRRRFLDAEGHPVADLPELARPADALVAFYRGMLRTRRFDARAVALQRSGQLGTFASSLGQEAVAVGVGSAMRPEDVLVPSFREQGAQLWRGVTPEELLLYWGGDERGSDFAGPREDFPVCIPVASHAPHLVGVAWAFQLRHEPRVAVGVFGDGATSKGDFYEALNLAGVWRLPAVFVVNDNQWAISVSRAQQSAAETLAQKAVAAGLPGEQVDGTDPIAVRVALDEALARARSGEGPTLIEALTYRLADHTTADDARRYRDEQEVSSHQAEDPVRRLRAWLEAEGAWSEAEEERALGDLDREMEAAAAAYLARPPQPPEAVFDFLHATLPEPLRAQRERLLQESGDD